MIQFFQKRSRTMVDSKDVISVKIEKINDTQIRCTLTSEDLADRQLKLSELAYGPEKAKDLFRDMILSGVIGIASINSGTLSASKQK